MDAMGEALELRGEQHELRSVIDAARLDAALETSDAESFTKLLGEVIKARLGYSAMASAAGLNRTALYKIASREGNPALHTLVSLLTPLGLRLSIKVITEQPGSARREPGAGIASPGSSHAYAQSPTERESSAE
jgi:probable addiction module antidote protein